VLGRVLGREEDPEPAVGDLAGELEVLRTDRREVDRDVLAHRVHGEGQRLAGAVGQRQREELAVVADALTAQGLLDDRDVLAGAGQRLVEPDAVPALGHLRSRDAEAQAEPAAGQRVEGGRGHRGHRGRAGRDLEDRRADVDALGLRSYPREDRDHVRAVGLGGPGDGVPEAVGLAGELEVVGVVARAPVAEVDAEPHALPLQVRIRCGRQCDCGPAQPNGVG